MMTHLTDYASLFDPNRLSSEHTCGMIFCLKASMS